MSSNCFFFFASPVRPVGDFCPPRNDVGGLTSPGSGCSRLFPAAKIESERLPADVSGESMHLSDSWAQGVERPANRS